MRRISTSVAAGLILGLLLAASGLRILPADGLASHGSTVIAVEADAQEPAPQAPYAVPRADAGGHGCAPAMRGEDTWDIAIHPGGTRAYVTNRSTDNLFVLDLTTHQIAEVIDLYPEVEHPLGPAPEKLALTADGSRLLVANEHDESVTVIDTATSSVVETLPVGGWPRDMAISPDGSLAYVPTWCDETMAVIDVTTAQVITQTSIGPGIMCLYAGAFAPDGTRVYVVEGNGTVHIIDPTTHTSVGNIDVPEARQSATGQLVITADSSTGYLAAMKDGKVVVLDLINGEVLDSYDVAMAQSVALSADESRLYVGTFGFAGESAYHLWMLDAQNGEFLAGLNFDHPGAPRLVGSDIKGLALTPDGSKLYAPSIDAESVFVVDTATLEQLGIIMTNPMPTFSPFRGTRHPDGSTLYIPSWTRQPTTLAVVDTASQRVVREVVAPASMDWCRGSWGSDITPDGQTLYVLGAGHCVLQFDTRSQEFLTNLEIPLPPGSWVTAVAIHPNGSKGYVLEYSGNVYVIDLTSQTITSTVDTSDECWVLKVSPDGERGYVICSSTFSILDLATDTVLRTIRLGDPGSPFEWLYYVGIKPDSSQYVVGAYFSMVVFDAATNTRVRDIDLREYGLNWLSLGQDLIFSSDDRLAYLALPDENAVAVFDSDTWALMAVIDTGHAPWFGTEPVWLLLSLDASTLYVPNELSDNVLVIDTATREVTGVISLTRCRLYLPLILDAL